MKVLSFDISSSGISAAVFNDQLEIVKRSDVDFTGSPLTPGSVLEDFKRAVNGLRLDTPLDAICLSTFMHSCLLLDSGGKPLSEV